MSVSPKVAVVIVAAGRGTRALSARMPSRPKQYQLIGGNTMLRLTTDVFLTHPAIARISIVINPEDRPLYDACIPAHKRLLAPAHGGATRQESVFAGLRCLAEHAPDIVLIHDGARPFLDHGVMDSVLSALQSHPAVVSGLPVFDTVKRVSGGGIIETTVDRSPLRMVQTPQGFSFPMILAAHEAATRAGRSDFTDDASVIEWNGQSVKVVPGSPYNVKVTTVEDFAAAEARLAMRWKPETTMDTRIGSGFDVHAFEPGDRVRLAGVDIPFDRKLKGHSDADVALHTLTDAIHGALADGDIGHHFPPSEAEWKDKDSAHFLRHAVSRVAVRQGRITNVDLTIICEVPKVGPHRDAMRASVASLLAIDPGRVSVKATTTEKLGFTGREEGIAAQAVVSIVLPRQVSDDIQPEELPFSSDLIDQARHLIELCEERGLKLATAESCTGGLIAGLLTSIAGSSAVIDRGFVTYSNEAKSGMLGVPDTVIADAGAVSEDVANAMAAGALARSEADIAVSVTGIAGPGGGSAEKPVGLVHFGCARKGSHETHDRIVFPDTDRTSIRRMTIAHALGMIRAAID